MRTSWNCCTAFLFVSLLVAGLSGCSKRQAALSLENSALAQEVSSKTSPETSPGNTATISENLDETVHFPNDSGGRLLAALLPPSEKLPRMTSAGATSRVRFAIPANLEALELRLPPSQATLPAFCLGVTSPIAQRQTLPEGTPLVFNRAEPVLPEHRDLPPGELTRVASPPVSLPSALPSLAAEHREPVSMEDATSEYSIIAALAMAPPRRLTPAPFQRITIPDPFEHWSAARLQTEPAEAMMPLVNSPRVPGR